MEKLKTIDKPVNNNLRNFRDFSKKALLLCTNISLWIVINVNLGYAFKSCSITKYYLAADTLLLVA